MRTLIGNICRSAGFRDCLGTSCTDSNPADAHSGNGALQLLATASGQATIQILSATPGQAYTFTGWGRSSTTGGYFALISLDSSWQQIGEVDVSFSGNGALLPLP